MGKYVVHPLCGSGRHSPSLSQKVFCHFLDEGTILHLIHIFQIQDDKKLAYAVLLLYSSSEPHVDSFWARVGILNIPLYFSLQRPLATLNCLVYSVKSSSSFCLVVIRFIMASVITMLAFFFVIK